MIWTPLEIAANLMTAICIILAGRNNIHIRVFAWWTGIVACVLFGVLFYTNQLYADMTLQIFFVVTGILGWIGWVKTKNHPALKITHADGSTLVFSIAAALLVAFGYGLLLHTYTDAYAPWIDSLVLTFSVVAHLLLMHRRIENWPVWLLVNTLSVPLFWSRELYLTSILYAGFWVNALWSWKHWMDLVDERKG